MRNLTAVFLAIAFLLGCRSSHGQPQSKYVPKPKPVRGEYEVGMYYFPRWQIYRWWSYLENFPERKPLLGYYREGDPEVADWQIKWMVEHGVTFIVYDWYWESGVIQLEHALENGYFRAKYRDKIKFCLLWANHNSPGTASAEDMVKVTRYWLDNYFLKPEYLKVDGKPVVIIFNPSRLTNDMGVEAVKQALAKSRDMAKERGLPGIYFAACTYCQPDIMKAIEQEGYDALTGYNYPSAGDKGQKRAPYDDMVTGYQEMWNCIADNSTLRYIPVAEAGWDSRPWDGPDARVRTGKSPAKFGKMLENAKRFVEQRTPTAKPKIVLLEAWNEFGEGDYIEPCKGYGFGYLDAVRDAFTSAPKAHKDVTPREVGLGPYEIPNSKLMRAWEFDNPKWSDGWAASQDLRDAKVRKGSFYAVSTNNDPAFYSDVLDIDPSKYPQAEIRMRVDKGKSAQLFWTLFPAGYTEESSIKFNLIPDGKFHMYRLNLAECPAWKSKVDLMRFDPTDAEGDHIEWDYIRFVTGK